jgi:hypothetical protein
MLKYRISNDRTESNKRINKFPSARKYSWEGVARVNQNLLTNLGHCAFRIGRDLFPAARRLSCGANAAEVTAAARLGASLGN